MSRNKELLAETKIYWENIRDGKVAMKGVRGCPLCEEYYKPTCEGCPIYTRTGKLYCCNTPIEEWKIHMEQHEFLRHYYGTKVYCEECQNIAQKMVNFIKVLQ